MPAIRRWWGRWGSFRRRHDPGADRSRCRDRHGAVARPARLYDPDDAVGGRDSRHRRDPEAPLPRHRRPPARGHLLRHRNRQAAVKAIAPKADAVIVIGAPNSSNSRRLVEVADVAGCKAYLLQRASDLDWSWLDGVDTLGISAGASAPELLVEELIEALRARRRVTIEEITVAEEDITFRLPRQLVA